MSSGLSTPSVREARRVGLRYVRSDEPGIHRRRCGKGFTYIDPDGETIRDPEVRDRIDSLVIPPGWTQVWICADPAGHIQATGRDERGRKQYRYHPDWEAARSEAKYARLVPFGEALPRLRKRVSADLARRGLVRERVLATVVSLMDRTLLRVGNQEYARDNQSFGLTTLMDRHVVCTGSRCVFVFRGKSGREREIEFRDRRLARIVRQCRDIPGQHLFQYIDDQGRRCEVESGDVNAYVCEAMGEGFSSKDFRTWGGSVEAAIVLAEVGPCNSETEGKRNVVEMVKQVAEVLGNTTAVCRDYYIHPVLIASYLDGSFHERWKRSLRGRPPAMLSPEEGALLRMLREG
jgi:DNA topoisomerase I